MIDWIFDAVESFRALRKREQTAARPWPRPVAAVVLGTIAGMGSLGLFPAHPASGSAWYTVGLVGLPIAAGLLLETWGAWRARRRPPVLRGERFLCGALFGLTLVLVRYLLA